MLQPPEDKEIILPPTVDDLLDEVDYSIDPNYVPSTFAFEFINFIKLVNHPDGEEDPSPIIHYYMADLIQDPNATKIAMLAARGLAKSAIGAEYTFLFNATHGHLGEFGHSPYSLYISDSIDNGVKKMRKRIERRIQNSPYLQEMLSSDTKFTDVTWYFKNKAGLESVVTGHGIQTGIRGGVELNSRPMLGVGDDVLSDKDARSPTVINAVEDVMHKALRHALHPKKRKVCWIGTPFNAKDPLYRAIGSGGWKSVVFPICEKFPCEPKEFRGAWTERFSYKMINEEYKSALIDGTVSSFYQELMLRITNDDERLLEDSDINWYELSMVAKYKENYNFYITTDFATTSATTGDLSIIDVWAYNNIGQIFWIEGIAKQQTMDDNFDSLFAMVSKYRPLGVGIETSGQQGGFIHLLQIEMARRNSYFNFAKDPQSKKDGIKPVRDKLTRFIQILPWFKQGRFFFPTERKKDPALIEKLAELKSITTDGIKSRYDDSVDSTTQLGVMRLYEPAVESPKDANKEYDPYWDDPEDLPVSDIESYLI